MRAHVIDIFLDESGHDTDSSMQLLGVIHLRFAFIENHQLAVDFLKGREYWLEDRGVHGHCRDAVEHYHISLLVGDGREPLPRSDEILGPVLSGPGPAVGWSCRRAPANGVHRLPYLYPKGVQSLCDLGDEDVANLDSKPFGHFARGYCRYDT